MVDAFEGSDMPLYLESILQVLKKLPARGISSPCFD